MNQFHLPAARRLAALVAALLLAGAAGLYASVVAAGHQDLERFDPAAYWQTVLPFLATHLRTADGPNPPP